MLEVKLFFPTGSLTPLAILKDGLYSTEPFRTEFEPYLTPEAAAGRLGYLCKLFVPLKPEIIG